MDSKKLSEHLEEFDLKDITTHFGGISDLLGFDQLEHAVQVSVLQARMISALRTMNFVTVILIPKRHLAGFSGVGIVM